MEAQTTILYFNMTKGGVVQFLLSKIVFLVIFCKNLGVIYGIELASSNGYVRREHSLTKPFQGKVMSSDQ